MRKGWRLWLCLLLCCSLMSLGVFSAPAEAAVSSVPTKLQFKAYYYTTNDELIYQQQYTTESGSYVNKSVDLPTGSHVGYVFVTLSGFDPEQDYNVYFDDFYVGNQDYQKFQLKQAYVQGTSGNEDIISYFSDSGNTNRTYDATFDVHWSSDLSQIVLYFEPFTSEWAIASKLYFVATLISVMEIGAGGISSEQQTQQDVGGILGVIKNIWNTVQSLPQNIANVVTSITELPSKIMTALKDLLEELFVPDEEEMKAVFDDFETYIEGKTGFLGQSVNLLKDFWSTLRNTSANGRVTIPAMSFPMNGETITISEAMTVDMEELDEDMNLMVWVRRATSMLMVIWIINLGVHELNAFLGNRSEV